MPIYQYHNKSTNSTIEIFLKMKDQKPSVIEVMDCGITLIFDKEGELTKSDLLDKQSYGLDNYPKGNYYRMYSVPGMIMDATKPKTVDDLARKNTERMRKRGELPPSKKKETPFWREGKLKPDLSLAKMTAKQKSEYIRTGKKV